MCSGSKHTKRHVWELYLFHKINLKPHSEDKTNGRKKPNAKQYQENSIDSQGWQRNISKISSYVRKFDFTSLVV